MSIELERLERQAREALDMVLFFATRYDLFAIAESRRHVAGNGSACGFIGASGSMNLFSLLRLEDCQRALRKEASSVARQGAEIGGSGPPWAHHVGGTGARATTGLDRLGACRSDQILLGSAARQHGADSGAFSKTE
jgi:hypothetical protein